MKPRPPSVNEICVKTGRCREEVMAVLDVLSGEEYIEWQISEPDKMEVFETERNGALRWPLR